MKKITTLCLVVLLPMLVLGAWYNEINTSNGTTPVIVVSAPGASTSRTVPANGGVTVYNTSPTVKATFSVQLATSTTTNVLETVVLNTNETWTLDYVVILDSTDQDIELVGATAFGTILDVTSRYLDGSQ